MPLPPGRRRLGDTLRQRWLAGAGLLAYVVTLLMELGELGSGKLLEPVYLGLLGLLALLAIVHGAFFAPRFVPIDGSILLIAALLVHAVVIVDLAPRGADLGVHVALLAVSALAAELPTTVLLALCLAGLHLGPPWAEGALTAEAAIYAGLPLALSALGVGLLARELKTRRRRAEIELRRFKALSMELDSMEEDRPATARMSEEDVKRRRTEAAMRLDGELRLVLGLVRRTLGATRVVLFDLDAASDLLRPRHAESEGPFDAACAIRVGHGPVGWVALRGAVFITPERRSEPADPGYCGKGPLPRTVLAVPVKRAEIVTGVLVADHLDAGAFTSGDAALLSDFSRWVVTLMESAAVMRHREEEAETFRALHDASQRLSRSLAMGELASEILTLGRHGAGFDRAYVIHREEAGGVRVLASAGQESVAAGAMVPAGVVSWATHLLSLDRGFILDLSGERRPMPLLSEDETSDDFRSILGVPMRLKGETVGGILLASRERMYLAREQQLLEILANQAGYAVDNARLYQRMEEMATTDGLTGLYNHRYFQEVLDRELERAERGNGKLSLALMDLDHFKKLNDTYGHPAGDQVLRELARILSATARRTDVVARYGGEEFTVILVDTDGRRAGDTAARIRQAVRSKPFAAAGRELKVTISIGIASFPDDARAKGALIECADRALYYSKENGRDQWNAYGKVKDAVGSRRTR